jgi:exopolysaccharide biosynthesis WecB/TagA/CpsF family protein
MHTERQSEISWPPKRLVFGVPVSVADLEETCDAILQAARQRSSAAVSAFSVHALIEAATTPDLAKKVSHFAMVTPDGQPVRWAVNLLCNAQLKRSVQGYEIMLRTCELAAAEGVSIYLYGGAPKTVELLAVKLQQAFPMLRIAGIESPPFRSLTRPEDDAMVERVNSSGAGLMFLGLGCPKQDHFAAAHLDRIDAVQLCVGAAFDFLAGTKPMAPEWMQNHGLAWVYRLYQEPGRLWKRYLVTNSTFLFKLACELVRKKLLPSRVRRGACGGDSHGPEPYGSNRSRGVGTSSDVILEKQGHS